MPPPTQSLNVLNPAQPPMGGGGSYYNPATAMQNNNMPPTQAMNFQTSAIGGPVQQGPPTWQTQPTQSMGGGGSAGIYADPNQQQQQQQSSLQSQRQPEQPKQKPPLPEEYIYLQTVLEELKTSCLNSTNDPVSSCYSDF